MQESTTTDMALAMDSSGQEARDVLTAILRQGAQRILAEAIENELAEYIAAHADQRDAAGHRRVVRNGHMPARDIQRPAWGRWMWPGLA